MKGLSVEPGERTALGEIDLAGAPLVEIIRRSDAGEHLAARIVDDHDGDRHVRAERARALAREPLEGLLQAAVDGEPDLALVRRAGHSIVGGMRRDHRHLLRACRHRLHLGVRDLVSLNIP